MRFMALISGFSLGNDLSRWPADSLQSLVHLVYFNGKCDIAF